MTTVKTVFEERRSVNFFDPQRPLAQETLEEIINLAVLAPSAFNLQPWRLLVAKTPEAKQRMFNQAMQQPKVLEAPVTLAIIGDRNGFLPHNPSWAALAAMLQDDEKVKGLQGFSHQLYGTSAERGVKFAESNAALLAMSIMIAAKERGVDSHAMSGIDFDGFKKEFQLAEHEDVVMLITLGYFDQSKTLYPRAPRRPYGEIATEL